MIWFLLSTAGLSYIVTRSELFRSLRDRLRSRYVSNDNKVNWWFHKIFSCPLCFGFYSGIFNRVMLSGFDEYLLASGFVGSIVSFFVSLLIDNLKEYGRRND